MQSILCYGDSNTWGRNPDTRERFDHNTRWTKVAQAKLGANFLVIEEGLVGRTTVNDDPEWDNRNGVEFLPIALETHMPLDMVIIALGANDLKTRFNLEATMIAEGIEKLVKVTRSFDFCPRHISLISPAPCSESIYQNSSEFEGAVEKSKLLAKLYRKIAEQNKCGFVDAGSFLTVSETDGLHFTADGHEALGQAMAEHISEVLT